MTQEPPVDAPGTWRSWTIWPPCVLAFVTSVYFFLLAVVVSVNNGFDGPTTDITGTEAALLGTAGFVAVATLTLLIVGLAQPPRRRAVAIAAWLLAAIPWLWLLWLRFGWLAHHPFT
jgi:hypothetical protein